MKSIGKIILTFAALLFLGGLFTLFWVATPGEITENKVVSRTYVGNGGMAARGAGYSSGATALRSLEYRYAVNNISYIGRSVRFSGGPSAMVPTSAYPSPITVYHSKSFPSVSVIDRGIPIFMIFLLILLGLGLIQMHYWFLKYTKPKAA